ncbi:hypothetical protein EUTSA_v10027013mg [Eutrema salsugineum]|uniref:F-box domain-containing protein n=1 Tax=Eutrema salsugineum TaxID=72664 RepID=V4MCM6_EUTSA|nr:hypothetical protein EUTSA_v10027013mg [Eutrema salsugineum]
MSDLPSELVEEILSRVPATYLKRFRSICKRWKDLFKDGRFIEKNFGKAPKQSVVLLVMLTKLITFSVSNSLNVADLSSIEFKVPLGLKNITHLSDSEKVREVFHCGGLLLCTITQCELVVWNPCYENNNNCLSFKILRYYHANNNCVGYEIYDFSSDSWRVLVDVVAFNCLISTKTGVSLKGNTYWLAFDETDHYRFLASFDFTRERFIERLSLSMIHQNSGGLMALSVAREKQLLVLHRISSKMDLWVTNNIGTEAVWSKSFTFDIPVHHMRNLYYIPISFVIDEEKKVVVCCDESNERSSKRMVYVIDNYHTEFPFYVETTQVLWCPLVFSYVPSLVEIQQVRRK